MGQIVSPRAISYQQNGAGRRLNHSKKQKLAEPHAQKCFRWINRTVRILSNNSHLQQAVISILGWVKSFLKIM